MLHVGEVSSEDTPKRTRTQKRIRHRLSTLDVTKLFKGRCFDDVLELELQRVLCAWHDYGDRVEGQLAHTPKDQAPSEELTEMLNAYSGAIVRIFEARRRADNQMTKRVEALTGTEIDSEIRDLIGQLVRTEYGDGTLGIKLDKTN